MTPSFAAVVPAFNEESRIAATVHAARSIPGVDLVVVVDDASRDGTADSARASGAITLRHVRNAGKAGALETGALAVAALDAREGTVRHLLLIDADLGDSAAGAAPLLRPVQEGTADLAIGLLPAQLLADGAPAGGHGLVVRLARDGIAGATGWTATQPLSGQRALTRAAFEAARPLAPGFGVETAMTLDLLRAGLRVVEVPVELTHRATGTDWRSQLHRARQGRDVARALAARRALPVPSRVSALVDLGRRR
jgi:glycosyltransferase involved in cell wall biosynthesis